MSVMQAVIRADRRRAWFGWASLALLVAAFGWTTYFLVTAPEEVLLRMHSSRDPDLGSKWRVIFVPILKAGAFAMLGQAERLGLVNGPEDLTIEEKRTTAAGLRVFVMFLLLMVLPMLVSAHWTVEQTFGTLLVAVVVAAVVVAGIVLLRRTRS